MEAGDFYDSISVQGDQLNRNSFVIWYKTYKPNVLETIVINTVEHLAIVFFGREDILLLRKYSGGKRKGFAPYISLFKPD